MNSQARSQSLIYQSTSPSLVHKISRGLVFKLLNRLKRGRIVLHEGKKQHSFGNDDHSLEVNIIVRDHAMYSRVLCGGSIGAGESYIAHQWDADDLTALVRIMAINMSLLDRMEQGLNWFLTPYRLVRHKLRSNNRQNAKKNILSHYDLGNELYESFLDPTMMYSAAIYADESSTLEEASLNKLDVICRKLDLQPGDKVIEIGTGWGGFAIFAASNYGCHVTTTTISEAQYNEAKERVAKAGLNDRITIVQKDYRDLEGCYDKLVSIEMIEAVGHKFLPTFLSKCCSLLKKDGLMLLQAITIADQKYEQYVHSVDFIQHHIFPGGCLVSNQRLVDTIRRSTDMIVRHVEDFGFDYARTLKDWRHRFNLSFSSIKEYGYDETFRRLWEFYLCYCEGGFIERSISVVHLMATRPENRSSLRIS